MPVLRGCKADQIFDLGNSEVPLSLRILRYALPKGTALVPITDILKLGITPEDFASVSRPLAH